MISIRSLRYFHLVAWVCWLVKLAATDRPDYGLVHIVTIKSTGIKEVKELRGRKLSLEEKESVNWLVGIEILEELNFKC